MEEDNISTEKKKGNMLVWIIVIIVVLLILFFMFRGGKEAGTKEQQSEIGRQQPGDEISNLDAGDNPDLGVDDLNSLQVSQEEIAG